MIVALNLKIGFRHQTIEAATAIMPSKGISDPEFNHKGLGSTMMKKMVMSAGVAAFVLMSATAGHAQSGPFAGLSGSWSGAGSVQLAEGSTERIRCRATYSPSGGSALGLTLRCASDSYKFDLSGNVQSSGNSVSGTWSEASRGINGTLSGRGSDGQFSMLVEAAGFAANLSLRTSGNKQSVSITSQGEIRSVSISLTRG